MDPDTIIPEPTRYYRRKLWKVSFRLSRVGQRAWRFCKFYKRRVAIGQPWKLVRGIAHDINRGF